MATNKPTKKQHSILAYELATIDANTRAQLNLSRDATPDEIKLRLRNNDRVYNERATALLVKLFGEEPETTEPAKKDGEGEDTTNGKTS